MSLMPLWFLYVSNRVNNHIDDDDDDNDDLTSLGESDMILYVLCFSFPQALSNVQMKREY